MKKELLIAVPANNKSNQLTQLIISKMIAIKQFEILPEVIIVNSTDKTTFFNMPLFVISSLDSYNKTYILGYALLSNENALNFQWGFEQ
jgi:hypothetical protein